MYDMVISRKGSMVKVEQGFTPAQQDRIDHGMPQPGFDPETGIYTSGGVAAGLDSVSAGSRHQQEIVAEGFKSGKYKIVATHKVG